MAEEYGHWYDTDGNLTLEVPYAASNKDKAGQMKKVTLREARQLHLLPSVTTVITLLDRPGLNKWKLDWALQIALAQRTLTIEEIIEEAGAYVEWAAQQGSKIHLGLSEHLQGRSIVIEPEIDEVVAAFWPWYRESGLSVTRSEMPVVSPLGYAGTIDYVGTYWGKPAVVDFKTQDFEDVKDALYYREHALQLSGYALAAGFENHERISVIISRQVPGLVAIHDWAQKGSGKNAVRDWSQIERFDSAWLNLWDLWQDINNYYPAKVYDPDNVGGGGS